MGLFATPSKMIQEKNMAQSKETNGRKDPRIPKEVHIHISRITYPMPEENNETVTGKNIAKGGICFTGSEPYESGLSVVLKIELRGWQHHKKNTSAIVNASAATAPLTAVAEVVWSKKNPEGPGYETGLKFTDIYEDDYKALKSHLERLTENARS